MKYLFAFILTANSLAILAQDSLATVYFYRGGKFAGSFVGYDLKHNNQVIGRVTSSSVVKYRCALGMQKFVATTESQNSIMLDVKAGETYYIECSVATGVVVGRPSFRQVDSRLAQKEIQKIDASLAEQLSSTQIIVPQEYDTVRALTNLFERKRKGGTTRAVVFGVLGVASLVGTLSYKESTVTVNQGSSGSQVIPVSSGPPVGNYVFVGFCAIMTFSGVSQTNNFSAENLDMLVNDYKAGKPLPQKIKRFLKKKDFK
jgi:Protein of unknown function (DUF2846)